MPIPVDSIRRSSIIAIPKQDIRFDAFDIQFCLPQTDSKDESRELEATYCRDFVCCNLVLNDLHELLQHYEEYHVSIEEDEEYFFGESSLEDGNTSIKKNLTDVCYNTQKTEEVVGKKRPAPSTLDHLTRSAIKRIAMGSISTLFNANQDVSIVSDEDLLAQASVLLASANNIFQNDLNADKPYKCSVKGCDKAYKNPNGLKYHNQHGHCNLLKEHDENADSSRPYQCTIGECSKRYKNLNGLKYHIEHSHMAALSQTLASFSSYLLSPLLD